jgi:hypothetical protein
MYICYLLGQSKRKSQLERQRLRWIDDIEMDTVVIGYCGVD